MNPNMTNTKDVVKLRFHFPLAMFVGAWIVNGFFTGTLPANELAVADGFIERSLVQYCRECHRGSKPKGDFQLERLSPDFNDENNRQRWLSVLEQLKEGTMPPKDKPRPPASEVERTMDWISQHVSEAESVQNSMQGRVVLRRLSRSEYENTVRDLLGVQVDLKDLLPQESPSEGFDNNAESA